MKHSELVQIAGKFLKNKIQNRCSVVFLELSSYSLEIPDAIGFNGSHSTVIECKTSKSDFKKDFTKNHRIDPSTAMGDYRYYLCTRNVLQSNDIPDGYGLIYVDSNKRTEIVVESSFFSQKNIRNEQSMMFSALRRVFQKKENIKQFKNFL